MKKSISLVLVAIMLLACISLGASAASEVLLENLISGASAGDVISIDSNTTAIVNAGETCVIPAGVTVKIASGGAIFVNGTLENNGTINASTSSGSFRIYGEVKNAGSISGNVTLLGSGTLEHRVTIQKGEDGLYDVYRMLDAWETVAAAWTSTSFYQKVTEDVEEMWIPHGKVFYLTCVITDMWQRTDPPAGSGVEPIYNKDAYDPAKLEVKANGALVPNYEGFFYLTVTNAMNITVGDNYGEDLIKIITVTLPRNTKQTSSGFLGLNPTYIDTYWVTALYNGEYYTDKVDIKYGDPLIFKVDLHEDYNNSSFVVTVHTSAKTYELAPNASGFYVFPDLRSTSAGYYSIFVTGVTANATQDKINGAVLLVQQIIATIADVFSTILQTLGIDCG